VILDEEIALKLLLPQFTSNPPDLERFKGEIKTARKVTHPNVIRIHELGAVGRDVFISMEMLTGGDLKSRIDAGALSLDEALRVTRGIAAGLQAAHDQGVIHRDLKPQNVLFDAAGTPKLSDFGIAKLAETTSNTVGYIGTPFYMAPEQARGAKADYRADVYALGVVMFQLVTGRLPFEADTLVGIAMMHATEPPPRPRALRAEIPERVEAVILRALEKDPDRRYQRPAELIEDLEGMAPLPAAALTAGSPRAARARASGSLSTSTQTAGESIALPRTRARGRVWLAAGIVALGALSAVVAVWRPWETKPIVERAAPIPSARSPAPTVPSSATPAVARVVAPLASTAPATVTASNPSPDSGVASRVASAPPAKRDEVADDAEPPPSAESPTPRETSPAPIAPPPPPAVAITVAKAAPPGEASPPTAVVPPAAPAAAPPADVASPRAKAEKSIADGDAAFADFNFTRAKKHYSAALAADPENATAREKLAKAKLHGRFGDMVYVPAGEFVVGSDDGDPDERPRRTSSARAFYIDKYEVSNAAYLKFVSESGARPPPDWEGGKLGDGEGSLAVSGVAWADARAYCRRRGKRLPSEVEWEKAARGTDGRRFPWGESGAFANVGSGSKSSVYGYKKGRSPYGAHHMAGNVWEWTSTRDPDSKFGEPVYIIRGGSYRNPLSWARAANKGRPTSLNLATIGFRCAR
jgi:serine/threonine protein kinase/formylglycine-generating enzyme required for sulfatase activity